MPPWTPTAWSSIITGKNPGKHGVFDMLWRRPGTYEFILSNARTREGTPFWKRLNQHGIRVGLVNIPFTHPPDEVDGFVVSGFGTPSSARNITYPAGLLEWIEQSFGSFQPVVDVKVLETASPEEILKYESEHQSRQVQVASALVKRHPVDVLAINLMLTDHANHKMPQIDQVQEAYSRSDHHLCRLIEAFQPDNIMVISDHGSNRITGDFLLNAWLRDQGYYVQTAHQSVERSATLNWILLQWLRARFGWSGISEKMLRHAMRLSLPVLPKWIAEKIWADIDRHIPFARQYFLYSNQPDFDRTAVFPGSVYSGLLYLNLRGREMSGTVPYEQRLSFASEIAQELSKIEDPDTGYPLFSGIYAAADLYSGPATENAPDLILDSYDARWNIRTNKYIPIPMVARQRYFVDMTGRRDFGWHSREGVFVFSGPGFSVGGSLTDGSVMDVPATLLHLYDVPIPEDYDGRVLLDLLSTEFCQQQVRYQVGDTASQTSEETQLSAKETKELMDHLKALGYLD